MGKLGFVVLVALFGSLIESPYPQAVAHKEDLRKNLKYYEILNAIDLTHHVVKRGINPSPNPYNHIKELQFNTLGRDFLLVLNPNKAIFHSQFKAFEVGRDGHETPILIDRDSFYEGRVFGEDDSDVRAHLEENGVMTATITTRNETYHIEPSWRHLKNGDRLTMITYKASDVKYSWEHDLDPKVPNVPVCAYIKEGNTNVTESEEEVNYGSILKRWKRESSMERRSHALRPHKTRCPLLLVADYRFYREMGGSSNKSTINYLISLIDRVTKIYEETQWRDKSDEVGFDGMGFVIKKIVVHSEPTQTQHGEMHYNMHMDKWDVRTLLEVFSREYTHKDFCLAHLFTDIKFEGGILGLAYVGSPRRNSVGGICTPEYFKNGYTLYLNSGLSSSRNHYGQRVITREADLVTAHEFGHNWGSEHDPDNPECSPSASQGGSYLMYTYSVSGYDLNNKRFSPCSLRSIRKVLLTKSERCFSEPEESFCGNLRVEGSEQCDAGLLGTEDSDACCRPNCTLRQGAVCSDKNSPCCQSCQFMAAGEKCREAQLATCEKESLCTGTSADCPKSAPMADSTPCLEKGQCKQGRCIPYCETLGKQSCMCDKLDNACRRCCRVHLNATCYPIEPFETLPNGTPCIQGICNNGQCERTVHDVVERFWDIIEEININRLLKFLKDNIVFTAVLAASVLWIPSSAIVSYIDRRSHKLALEEDEWSRNKSDLIHPADSRPVIYIRPKLNSGEHTYGINQ
ncbi:unnamed protein product [Allacma fusca]|uniref:ADAM 17-like protease n=1 Tax=Allacma fusca TaxID=39272 RepID=A0A8J2PIP4_9HEXA|nr:unnamed protein product [Allacma fusca]